MGENGETEMGKQMASTAMKAALESAGFDANEMRFLTDLSRYLNNGGTVPRAHVLVDEAAQRMPGEGQVGPASKEAICVAPSSRQPIASGEGHVSAAPKSASLTLPPAREPSPSAIAAMREARKSAAVTVLTVFDTYRLRGRIIGDIARGDIPMMKRACDKDIQTGRREMAMLTLLETELGRGHPDIKVREQIGEKALQRLIQKAAEMADAG